MSSIQAFLDWLIETVGYTNTMRIKNIFIFMAGGYVYLLVGVHIVVKAAQEIQRDKRASKVSLMRINGMFLANPNTSVEYHETLWVWIATKLQRNRTITFRSVRLAKTLMLFFRILAVVFIIVGIWLMLEIQDSFYLNKP